jgi:hypothetical protein
MTPDCGGTRLGTKEDPGKSGFFQTLPSSATQIRLTLFHLQNEQFRERPQPFLFFLENKRPIVINKKRVPTSSFPFFPFGLDFTAVFGKFEVPEQRLFQTLGVEPFFAGSFGPVIGFLLQTFQDIDRQSRTQRCSIHPLAGATPARRVPFCRHYVHQMDQHTS